MNVQQFYKKWESFIVFGTFLLGFIPLKCQCPNQKPYFRKLKPSFKYLLMSIEFSFFYTICYYTYLYHTFSSNQSFPSICPQCLQLSDNSHYLFLGPFHFAIHFTARMVKTKLIHSGELIHFLFDKLITILKKYFLSFLLGILPFVFLIAAHIGQVF